MDAKILLKIKHYCRYILREFMRIAFYVFSIKFRYRFCDNEPIHFNLKVAYNIQVFLITRKIL